MKRNKPLLLPQNRNEEQLVLSAFKLVITSLESVIGSNLEILLHDLHHPRRSTLAIANGHVTGRQVGDPIIAAPKNDKGFSPLLGTNSAHYFSAESKLNSVECYTSRTKDGRELRSSTVFLRNREGQAFATVCANYDLTVFQLLQTHLQQFVQQRKDELPSKKSRPKVDELIEEIISESIASIGKPVVSMDADEKVRVIEMMVERGLFMIKGSAERVARRIGVSRFTVYNYLARLKGIETSPTVQETLSQPRAKGDSSGAKIYQNARTAVVPQRRPRRACS